MILLVVVTVLIAFVYWKNKKHHRYWLDRGVPQLPQFPLLGDNAPMVFRKTSFAELYKKIYLSFPNSRFVGTYQSFEPVLLLRDPELIKQVTVKDFEHFADHKDMPIDDNDQFFSKSLARLQGEKWKKMRNTLSPTFTGSKIKMMFHLMAEISEKYSKNLTSKPEGEVLEIGDIFGRFTTDIIASCAFGVEVDSLKDKMNKFYTMGKSVTDFSGFLTGLKFTILFTTPKLAALLRLKLFSDEITEFFQKMVHDSIKMRADKGVVRLDMIHLLVEARAGLAKQKEAGLDELTDVDIAAQVLIFFLAGYVSVSSLLTFLMYELALNEDIQRRLREEIDKTLEECGGNLTYEALVGMPYLDMVVSEALRKWPNGTVTDRKCTKDYTIRPVNENEPQVDLKAGDNVWIPIFPIQRDPEYFPDPDSFDPERFSEENKRNIKPYTYFPFGQGPRNCIGSRFALIEAKVICFYILSRLEVSVSEKTAIPVKLVKGDRHLLPEGGMHLHLKPRK